MVHISLAAIHATGQWAYPEADTGHVNLLLAADLETKAVDGPRVLVLRARCGLCAVVPVTK